MEVQLVVKGVWIIQLHVWIERYERLLCAQNNTTLFFVEDIFVQHVDCFKFLLMNITHWHRQRTG